MYAAESSPSLDHRWRAENPIPWIGACGTPLLPRRHRVQHPPHLPIGGGLMGKAMPEIREMAEKAHKTMEMRAERSPKEM